jgi:hypothetical protein
MYFVKTLTLNTPNFRIFAEITDNGNEVNSFKRRLDYVLSKFTASSCLFLIILPPCKTI